MKKMNFIHLWALCLGVLYIASCHGSATEKQASAAEADPNKMETDMVRLKNEIQNLETNWAAADDARDTNALAAFYADDAISLVNKKPMLIGKVAIRQGIVEEISRRPKGSTISFDIMDVFGDKYQVTEVGKTTIRNTAGQVISISHYIAIWENRNGKYLIIRDMGNDDQ